MPVIWVIDFGTIWSGSIIGSTLSAALDYRNADYNGQLFLLMGNEQSGLTDNLREACRQLIKLPMLGRSDSLNLAVATGVVLYEALARRG